MTYSLMNVISDGFSRGMSFLTNIMELLRFLFNASFQTIHCIICRVPTCYIRHNQHASKSVLMLSEAWVLLLCLFQRLWHLAKAALEIFLNEESSTAASASLVATKWENGRHSVDGLASGSHPFWSLVEMLQHQWTQHLPLHHFLHHLQSLFFSCEHTKCFYKIWNRCL